jgi:hypothetical protein
MIKSGLFLLLGLIGGTSIAQIKKQFSVESNEGCHAVKLQLKSKTGNCFIRSTQNSELLAVYSNQNLEEYNHNFSNEIKDKTCMVKLALEQEAQQGVGKSISYQVFGKGEKVSDKFWKVYLTESMPYFLDLDYGLGNANIDLSGLSIQKLKIKTASADVNINYASGLENKTDMDTFYVKVDLGSVNARQLNLSRAKVVVADVGFGNILLDFGQRSISTQKVIGSVGAGNLIVHLPSNETPVLVTINDSWLCSLNLCKSLKKIGENKFANDAYTKNSKNALSFDLDVSMGKIVFKESHQMLDTSR